MSPQDPRRMPLGKVEDSIRVRHERARFTLEELPVVVAGIALSIAVLMASRKAAHLRTESVKCRTDLWARV